MLAVIGSSARAQPEMTVRPIIESAGAGKPLAAFFVPEAPQALAMLSRAGVPNFRTPEACADAIAAALVAARAPRRTVGSPPAPPDAATRRLLDELEAGALLDRLGIARAPSVALDAGIAAAAAAALSLSGRRQGSVRRDRAQDRCRRRRARRCRRRRRCIAAIRQIRATVAERAARHARRARAGAADDRRRRRGARRLPRRPRRRPAGDGGDRRRLDRDRARPQPAARAGRRRDRRAR